MMVSGKDDLGLSLTLGSSYNNHDTTTTRRISSGSNTTGFFINQNNTFHHLQTNTSPFQLNLMMMPSLAASSTTTATATATASPSPSPFGLLQKLPWNRSTDSFPPSSDRSFLKGIDVNRPAGAEDDDAGVSSPNSTVSTLSGKRSSGERESETNTGAGDDNEVERASSRGMSDDEDAGENCRKKLRLTKDQSAILEESFKEHNTLNPKQKLALAKRLGLRPRQVEVWFQNRRARTKLKQTEVDCEFLKRCCEQLTEENRRLQKEVAELRSLKLSPQFYMQMTPPTTLTMCPSCERVATPTQPDTRSGPTHNRPMHVSDTRPGPTQNRPTPVNPWAPVPIRPFEALQPRS